MIMLKKGIRIGMVNWKVTATSIYCDAVDDEVTIMVYKDWTAKCSSFDKYHEPSKEISRLLKKKSKQLKRQLECNGPECSRVIQYREKLMSEEASKDKSASPQTGSVSKSE